MNHTSHAAALAKIATSDGLVRELSSGMGWGGTTWSTEYDLTWVRRAG